MIIRPLTVFEREAARGFYLSLSPDDRRKRFCCSLSDETISKYVDRLNFTHDTVLGAFDEQAPLTGLAELVRGAVESGDYASTSEVVREALREWKQRRTPQQRDAEELRQLWAEGLTSGPGRFADLDAIKAEARRRFDERQHPA